MVDKKKILLTFDVEEFDLPKEYQLEISQAEQLSYSRNGLIKVLDLLDQHRIKATFFTTAYFAENNIDLMQRIGENYHEIASHMYYHDQYNSEHIASSKQKLEEISGQKVYGIRSPRLAELSSKLIKEAGYTYNSSLNPTYIPGRYNNFKSPRSVFMEKESQLLMLPFSVATFLRIPLFWLMFKNLHSSIFLSLCQKALKKDGYLHLYFHPWEFVNLDQFNIPKYIKADAGLPLLSKLEKLINSIRTEGEFCTAIDFLNQRKLQE